MNHARLLEACPWSRQHLALRSHLADAGLGSGAVSRAIDANWLVRVTPGVYSLRELPRSSRHLVSSGVPDREYLAHVRAALLAAGRSAMAGGRTAAVLWGFDMLVEPATVEVVWPESRRARRFPLKGVTTRRLRGAAALEEPVLGFEPVSVLTPLMTVVDCALSRPLREAVVIADSALRSGRVTLEQLEREVDRHRHHPNVSRLRRVASQADPSSGSVLESLLRLLLAQHGLRPESQVTLLSSEGQFIGRVDFLFRDQRLVVECDGRRWHDPDDARERDRLRDNELERAAWRLVRITWDDVVSRPAYVVALVQACLEPWPATLRAA